MVFQYAIDNYLSNEYNQAWYNAEYPENELNIYVSTDAEFSDSVVCYRYEANSNQVAAWRYYCDSLGKYISVENVNMATFNTLQVAKVVIFGEEYYQEYDDVCNMFVEET